MMILIINSYRIPGLDGVIYNHKEVAQLRTEYYDHIVNTFKDTFKDDISYSIDECRKFVVNTDLELPIIDIGFCMKTAWNFSFSSPEIHFITKTKYVFSIDGVISSIIDLDNKIDYRTFYHVWIIDQPKLKEYIKPYEKYVDDLVLDRIVVKLSYTRMFLTPIFVREKIDSFLPKQIEC